jgi:hypothetical protein
MINTFTLSTAEGKEVLRASIPAEFWTTPGEVKWQGNTELLERVYNHYPPCLMSNLFSRAAHQHGLLKTMDAPCYVYGALRVV